MVILGYFDEVHNTGTRHTAAGAHYGHFGCDLRPDCIILYAPADAYDMTRPAMMTWLTCRPALVPFGKCSGHEESIALSWQHERRRMH